LSYAAEDGEIEKYPKAKIISSADVIKPKTQTMTKR